MALGNIYVDALEHEFGIAPGWFANWPMSSQIALGDVGFLQESDDTGIVTFQRRDTLHRLGVPFAQDQASGVAGDISLSAGAETSVEFGLDASVDGWQWLGAATAGFHAQFGSAGGLRAEFADVSRRRVDYVAGLEESLLAAANDGRLPVHTAVVVEYEEAANGMLIASTSQAADLRVSTDVKLEPAQLKLAKFAASFSVQNNSGSAVVQPMRDPFIVAFRTLVIGTTGIWWWKRIVITGAAGLSMAERLDATELAIGDEDYLVRF